MEDSSGWGKPFIASFIVFGIALLVFWLIVQYYINKVENKISNIARYVNSLVTPTINYFMSVARYTATSSDELYQQMVSSGQKLTKIISEFSDPAKASLIGRLLQEKVQLTYKSDKLAEQSQLNQKIAEASSDIPEQQKDIKSSLDGIDQMLSQSLGNPTLFRNRVSAFSMSLLRGLLPDY